MTANSHVQASIVATEVLEEGGDRAVLVARAWPRARKMVRQGPPQGRGSLCRRRWQARDLGERSDMVSNLHPNLDSVCKQTNDTRRTDWAVGEEPDIFRATISFVVPIADAIVAG